MCGIIGYAGKRSAAEILLDGLKKLEYRGYDSSGISIFENGRVYTIKTAGRVGELEKKTAHLGKPYGNVGIGHTRWATHGGVSDENSHPHSYGRITLVHNGIIENHMLLKERFSAEGDVFSSQTDTETAAHLLERIYDGDPVKALCEGVKALKGSYALAVMFSDIPDKLFCVRCDSPLVIGIGEGEGFISSDISAISSYTCKYYLPEENEIGVISQSGVSIFNSLGEDITESKKINIIHCNSESAQLGTYPHYMLKEICEQVRVLKELTQAYLSGGVKNIFGERLGDTSKIKRVIIVGCGSALNAGLLGKYAIERLARVGTQVCIASEFRYGEPIFDEGDAVLVISQSGETADSLAALRLAKKKGIPVYGMVNVPFSSIARECDYVIYTMAGQEIAVATTKAYTAQVTLLYILGLHLALERGRISEKDARKMSDELMSLPNIASEMLGEKNMEHYKKLAEKNKDVTDFFIIGRGADYALAAEAAMKIKEVSYIHCEAYAAAELKHGTISLIDDGVPCMAIITDKELGKKTINNIKEVMARGGDMICVLSEDNALYSDICDKCILIPSCNAFLAPIAAVIPIQAYAYYTALHRSCDIDKPRNLAKSVTVE